MKRFICLALFSVLLFVLSACARPEPTDENPIVLPEAMLPSAIVVQPTSTEVATVMPTVTLITSAEAAGTAVPTPTATPIPIPTITRTPIPTEPTFTNLHFVLPNSSTAKGNFAAGTEEVFAAWDYANMSATDSVRREWYHNGDEWLVREETWNMEQYGANGRISDISIYNFEGTGLEPGEYQLLLYINGVLAEDHTFSVIAPPTPTPDPAVAPTFSNLLFQTNGITQTIFPTNVTEVFAVWDYTNIPDRAELRIVWGEAGGGREHILNWDVDQYGTSGTISEFSLKRLDNQPLSSGLYMLTVYLDQVVMLEDAFIVGTLPPERIYTDPTGTYTLKQWSNYLFMEGEGGDIHFLGSSGALSEFGAFHWAPNGEWLMYEIVRTDLSDTPYMFGFVELTTHSYHQISGVPYSAEYSISPTIKYISTFDGSYLSCSNSQQVWHLLTWDGGNYELRDFLQAPRLTAYGIHPRSVGIWENGGLTLELEASCTTVTASAEDLLLEGVYFLDLTSYTMTRVGDLP